MTHTLNFLRIQFDEQIQKHEIELFRGAVISKVGYEDTLLFHNHLGANNYAYQYPFIQYKQIHKQPSIICLDKGVEAIQKLLSQPDWDLLIGKRVIQPKVSRMDFKKIQLKIVADQTCCYSYKILNWVALNKERYKDYQALGSEEEKRKLLESILTGNILSMSKSLGWFIDQKINTRINNIEHVAKVTIKKQKHFAFTLQFSCNVLLPSFIGLGRSVSIGFGMILRNNK